MNVDVISLTREGEEYDKNGEMRRHPAQADEI